MRYKSYSWILKTLAAFWIIDALLEFQPKMFSAFLGSNILKSTIYNQPKVIADIIQNSVHLLLLHPALYNAIFGFIELLIGILLFTKKGYKTGLILSIFWSLFIWIFGEGMGNLFTRQALISTGAPGAGLIYALISLAIYLFQKRSIGFVINWFKYSIFGYYLLAILLILSSFMNPRMNLASSILNNAQNSPGIISKLDYWVSHFLNSSSDLIILMTILIYLFLMFAVFFNQRIRNIAIYLGIILALFFWVVAQNFGGILIFEATDPNSAPLIIFLLLIFKFFASSKAALNKSTRV